MIDPQLLFLGIFSYLCVGTIIWLFSEGILEGIFYLLLWPVAYFLRLLTTINNSIVDFK